MPAPFVRTVAGDVPPDSLGFTLPHEHTAIQLWQIPNRWDYWELTRDEEIATSELRHFRERGGTALVDLTLPGVGRDPEWLRGLSASTDVAIVMGCGWYRGAYYPAEALIDRRTADDLAEEIVGEFRDGVAGTGIRPGIIGEIGVDKPWLSAQEERVHRAAARASRATGMAITTHSVMSDVGLAQLEIFDDEGADLSRAVIGHADSYPSLDYYMEIVKRGAIVEFDFLGMRFTPMEKYGEPRLIRLLCELVERGHAERVLLSQDVCHNSQLRHYHGAGYTYISESFLPRLREAGVDDATIEQITVLNPRRLLTIA